MLTVLRVMIKLHVMLLVAAGLAVNTDNMTSQQVLSLGAGRDPIICACAQRIWLIAVERSMEVNILHKPGRDIVLADALSRMCFDHRACNTVLQIVAQNGLQRVLVSHNHTLASIA